jgi:hypothetical protein
MDLPNFHLWEEAGNRQCVHIWIVYVAVQGAKKPKKSNQPPSGLRSGWDSAIKSSAPADKSNQEDDIDSLVWYGGMVGDEENDEMEWSVIMNDKGPKRGPNRYVRTAPFTCKQWQAH